VGATFVGDVSCEHTVRALDCGAVRGVAWRCARTPKCDDGDGWMDPYLGRYLLTYLPR
jgi:hypothetical protein